MNSKARGTLLISEQPGTGMLHLRCHDCGMRFVDGTDVIGVVPTIIGFEKGLTFDGFTLFHDCAKGRLRGD